MTAEWKIKNFSYRNYSSAYNRPISEIRECLFCRDKNHVSLFDCEHFKVSDSTTRFRFVLNNGLCWRCLVPRHRAFECPEKRIEACDKWAHCKLVCNCSYNGKKFISGSLAVQRSLHNTLQIVRG